MPFAKMPKTNRRTDILPNMVAVFRIILYYKSVTKYRRTRHTFTKSNGLYAMSLGLPMYDAPNAVEKLKQPRKHPTPEKVEAIKDALKHFEVI